MAVVLDAISSGRIRWNDRVTASEEAVRTGGAQIWLELGETMTVQQLFYAVAVQSANDAAVALAEYVGGTVPHFVQMMNAKAQALGMRDTLYTDPDGLDDTNQYTSAYDVALLSRYLVTAHPDVLKYTATWEYRLRNNKLWMVNRNKLLTRFTGTDGLKTGFTTQSGYCLAATARRGPTRLISVVLGDPTGPARFNDSMSMLQWGFSNYTTVQVAKAGSTVAELPVEGGRVRSLRIVPQEAFGVTVPRGREKAVRTQVALPSLLQAPLRAGDRVGEIRVSVDGRPVASVPLVTARAAPRIGGLGLWLRVWAGLWPWLRS
jgi:D-alanyl-D-alanine carboxypeptidase (penicillin-binding protein 5/6)